MNHCWMSLGRLGVALLALAMVGLAQTAAVQFTPTSYPQVTGSPVYGGTAGFGSGGDAFATGDVNGDGITDVVVIPQEGAFATVLLGDGTGKFPTRIDTAITPNPDGAYARVALGDFNGDGHLDLVISSTFNIVQIMIGDGMGHFTAGAQLSEGRPGYGGGGLVVTDLNRDGKLDVVDADSNGSGVTVYLGQGNGTLAAGVRYDPGGSCGTSVRQGVAIGDFNNDGIPDVAMACGGVSGPSPFGPGQTTSGQIALFLGNGDGTLATAIVTAIPYFPYEILAADLNLDGNLDLVLFDEDGTTNHVHILLGTGTGRFPTPVAVATNINYQYVGVSDVNGDGIPDILISAQALGPPNQENFLSVLLGHGDGTYAPSLQFTNDWGGTCTASSPTGCSYPLSNFVLADVNGDEKPDLVFPITVGSSTSNGVFGIDLNTTATPVVPVVTAVANAASDVLGSIAPGEIVTVYGSGLGPSQLTSAAGSFATQLAGSQVFFNGTAAPLIYSWGPAVSAVVPYEVSGSSAQVTVMYQGQTSSAMTVPIASSAPGIFVWELLSSGKGQALVENQDGSINSAATPAKIGSIVTLYATGEGQTSPGGVDGKIASVPAPKPLLPVTVNIGGQTVQPQYAGGAPGEVAGVMQINVQVPSGIQAGSAVAITVQVGSASSQTGVTIAVSGN
jgi:uncharacterized protein (TIGR03437 family)